MFNFLKSWRFWLLVSLLLLVGIGPYIFIFHGGLSTESSEWGNFGSYLSGIFGPILSVLSMLVIVWTVHKQITENQKYYDAQLHEERFRFIKQRTRESEIAKRQLKSNRNIVEYEIRTEKLEKLCSLFIEIYSYYISNFYILEPIMRTGITNVSEDMNNEFFENQRCGRKLIMDAQLFLRIYLDGEIGLSAKHLLDHLYHFFHCGVDLKVFVFKESSFPIDGYKFYDYFNSRNVEQWVIDITQAIIESHQKKSVKPDYYESSEYQALHKEAIYTRMNLTSIDKLEEE